MERKIKIKVKLICGVHRGYPECDISRAYVERTGRKTLDNDDLAFFHKLGYEIDMQEENISTPKA